MATISSGAVFLGELLDVLDLGLHGRSRDERELTIVTAASRCEVYEVRRR